MRLCLSIEPLAIAYFDDELAGEERRELELHLIDCPACRQHVATERVTLARMRHALTVPPAPDSLRVAVASALDAEDRSEVQRGRRRRARWALPAGAIAAAATALLAFGGLRTTTARVGAVTHEAVRQHLRRNPLEVQGPSTGPWMREHFAAVEAPQLTAPSLWLLGGRLASADSHDAALWVYELRVPDGNRFRVDAFVVCDIRGDELAAGRPIEVAGRILHVIDADGVLVLTYVDTSRADGRRIGYVFTSDRLTLSELVGVVATWDLIAHAPQQRM